MKLVILAMMLVSNFAYALECRITDKISGQSQVISPDEGNGFAEYQKQISIANGQSFDLFISPTILDLKQNSILWLLEAKDDEGKILAAKVEQETVAIEPSKANLSIDFALAGQMLTVTCANPL